MPTADRARSSAHAGRATAQGCRRREHADLARALPRDFAKQECLGRDGPRDVDVTFFCVSFFASVDRAPADCGGFVPDDVDALAGFGG
ncbi:hypothetical protein EW146_g7494 [Bondarzewia mesenterica]|uniref:Uncharacterized protein n=1 Tax=Bondarzewia mesenterica TaxID=1095465 RepID=A0A4S4LMH7_9AGAM|nr:hypothetical protein EW146_g7494 [Bondarzewia mesenterica]